MNNYDDNWSDSLDDAGSSYWENYFSGPDDGHYEDHSCCHNDSDQKYDEYGRLLPKKQRDDYDEFADYFMECQLDKHFKLVQNTLLPSDFKFWHAENSSYWSIAHEAARYGNLPLDFKQWSLADKEGWTVAHEAARRNNLPKDFAFWNIKSNYIKFTF